MLKKYRYKVGKPMNLIGGLIPEGKTTLLHGRSGSGKTLSMIKFFKQHDAVPVFIDFDNNDEYNASKSMVHIDGELLCNDLLGDDGGKKASALNELKGHICIIDTYAKASMYLRSNDALHGLIDMLVDNGCTVIVIAHTIYYSGKPSEPAVAFDWSNHVACRLHLHNEVKKTKTDVYLEIEKLRGVNSSIIHNWMRDQ